MGTEAYPFEEFPWQEEEPNARRERLCARKPRSAGGTLIDCAIEGASFARDVAPAKDELVVLAYNVERGFKWREQLQALQDDPDMPAPDVILLSEADRGCSRTGWAGVAREWAREQGMYYVFGVEFVELPRFAGPGRCIKTPCEHGNAVLSRYPLGNVRLIRHRETRSWNSRLQRWLRFGQPRYGGRVALAADAKCGERLLRVYSVHFESKAGNEAMRTAEAAEAAEDGLAVPHGAIIAGDMNCSLYLDDLKTGASDDGATQALLGRGYADAHAGLPPEERGTTRSGVAIDLIFGTRVSFTAAGVGRAEVWGELSDHLPVWARVRLG